MAKKNKDEWTSLVKKTLNRKRSNRDHKVPVTYIGALVDRLHKMNPTKEILFNTLVDFYGGAFEDGYTRKGQDMRFFKDKQNQHIDAEFKKFTDEIDDIIHCKNLK